MTFKVCQVGHWRRVPSPTLALKNELAERHLAQSGGVCGRLIRREPLIASIRARAYMIAWMPDHRRTSIFATMSRCVHETMEHTPENKANDVAVI